MDATFSENDILDTLKDKIYTQNYSEKDTIDGVSLSNLDTFVSEDGDFSEVFRLSNNGEVEQFPGFKIAQANRSKLNGRSVKAWHAHFNQDEIWYVAPSHHLLIGLWDIRKNSKTADKKMRVVLGGGKSQLLLIPRGVAHGGLNLLYKPCEIMYFVNQVFDRNNPDEKRMNWDILGAEFWSPARD